MEKFLCSSTAIPPSCSDGAFEGGLLDLMQKSRDAKTKSQSGSSSPSVAPLDKWEDSHSTNHYTLHDINFHTKHTQVDKESFNRGWRVVNGEKVYVTMRRGGVVRATGQEAFLLSRADDKAKSCKRKKGMNTESVVRAGVKPALSTSVCPSVEPSGRKKPVKMTDHFLHTPHTMKEQLSKGSSRTRGENTATGHNSGTNISSCNHVHDRDDRTPNFPKTDVSQRHSATVNTTDGVPKIRHKRIRSSTESCVGGDSSDSAELASLFQF